jgi:hypothetical protein
VYTAGAVTEARMLARSAAVNRRAMTRRSARAHQRGAGAGVVDAVSVMATPSHPKPDNGLRW